MSETIETFQAVKTRIKYMDRSVFCAIHVNGLTKESFLNDSKYFKFYFWTKSFIRYFHSVSSVANIEKSAEFTLFDHTGAEIPFAFLEDMIIQKQNSDIFSIRIEIVSDTIPKHLLVLVKVKNIMSLHEDIFTHSFIS